VRLVEPKPSCWVKAGPWLTTFEPFRWGRLWQAFPTLPSDRCLDSNGEQRAPIVDCAQVPPIYSFPASTRMRAFRNAFSTFTRLPSC
jgi:hypothetical protein